VTISAATTGLNPSPSLQRDAASAAFFDALHAGFLLLKRCVAQGHVCAPDALACPSCAGTEFEDIPAKGTGIVITWGVVHARLGTAGASPAETVIGIVELDEGPWLHSALVGLDPATLRAGTPVKMEIRRSPDSEPMYVFGPNRSA